MPFQDLSLAPMEFCLDLLTMVIQLALLLLDVLVMLLLVDL